MKLKNLAILATAVSLFAAACKKKPDQSAVTGWNYNDSKMGGFQVSKEHEQRTGPGLVFVQGGTFTMGATQEDVMRDWNNVPRRVTVNSFYIDQTEVANIHYREYLYWVDQVFDADEYKTVRDNALPDTLCWRSELAYNEPMVEYYFRHPSYNFYPVVGVTWRQAHDFCLWRSDRVNELTLIQRGYINANSVKNLQGLGQENFNTKAYLMGEYQATPDKKARSKSNPLKNPNGTPRTTVTFEDGILLPTTASRQKRSGNTPHWAISARTRLPSHTDKTHGEELIANKQVYSWASNVNGLREERHGSWQGTFMANFKRGSGDNMGVAGGLNDNAVYTAPVTSYFPNAFGLYNMSGNVSEWVFDVYRPMSTQDVEDVAPFRGNKFETVALDKDGKSDRDSLGRIKMRNVTNSESHNRRNYQKGDVINYLDGDSIDRRDQLRLRHHHPDQQQVPRGQGRQLERPRLLAQPRHPPLPRRRPGEQHHRLPLRDGPRWQPRR